MAFIARMVEWEEVGRQMHHAKLMPFVWVTALWIIHFMVRALRWRYLLPGGVTIRVRLLFDSIMLGNFATFTLPLRAGEFIRPLFLSKQSALSFSSCFVSVVIERFFDLSMVLAMFAYVAFTIPGLPSWTRDGAFGLSTLAVGIFVFIIVGTFLPKQTISLIKWATSFLPQKFGGFFEKFLGDFIGGASVLKNPLSLAKIFILTAIVWALNVAIFYTFMDVISIDSTFVMGLTLTVLVALAVAAPSAPGFLGVFQAGCIASFALFGKSAETATAYSLLNHVHQFLIIISYGIYILFAYGVSFRDLRAVEERTS